jgi:cold shock CspA family protein
VNAPPVVDPSEVFTDRRGVVAGFDDHVGAGTVADHGPEGRSWSFHCTRIADGSRTIGVGAEVTYRIEPGPTGLEAVGLTPLSAVR